MGGAITAADLLADARTQAERSEAPVRAAALLRIARVETALDAVAARATFVQALQATRQIPGVDGEFLLRQARLVAAAAAPDLLDEIAVVSYMQFHRFGDDDIVAVMLEHGNIEEAVAYLDRCPGRFPFGQIPVILQKIDAQETRAAVLRRAVEAWRTMTDDSDVPPDDEFVRVFQRHWKVLPPDEALAVAREIVGAVCQQAEQPMTATYDDGKLQLTSSRAHTLFVLLSALRQLDPPLAQSLIEQYEQLGIAARRYPNGLDSLEEEAEHRRQTMPPPAWGAGYILMGSPEDFPYLQSLVQASRDGNFEPPFDHALARYRDDTAPGNPNTAAREFWPSAGAFRGILYSAGKRLGADAAAYLPAVPDPDLRLFAQVELAGALAGLPQSRGTQRTVRNRALPA